MTMSATTDAPASALMDVADVCRELRLGRRTLWRWISEGRFPGADLSIGPKVRRWRRETVERWIESQTGGDR